MAQSNNRKRIHVDLGSTALYRALKFAAVERGVPARQIVVEALREWLDRNHSVASAAKEGGDGH